MIPEEIEVIRRFLSTNDPKTLTEYARKSIPSKDFLEFLYHILDHSTLNVKGTRKIRGERTLALVMALCDLPKSEKNNPKSVFCIVGDLYHISPSTLYKQYYKYKDEPETKTLIETYKVYLLYPAKVNPKLLPIFMEIKEMVELANALNPEKAQHTQTS